MGIEDQRKKLMANGPTWGDRRSVHVAGGPREGPDSDDLCNCDIEVLTPIVLMNYVDSPPPSVSHIFTRGWTLEDILNKGKRFRDVPRVALKEATKAIIQFDRDGVPLIIEGLHEEPNWPKEDFHPDWLRNHGPEKISVRNVYNRTDKTLLLDQFIEQCRSSSNFASPEEKERLYGKDVDCPKEWAEWLRNSKVVPLSLIPNNAEDLLSRHVETLMCYIGVGDTFTPCHKDLCASSGQNLMCYTEMDGSSFWFMTKGADAPEASKYFHELKQELDHETHVITIEQLANAPFDVYIAEQKLGDLVLVPPRSCHQVVNYGGITIKTSWSRMTLKGLETAYYHELPIYRRVCRPEIYRVKSTIYQTLIKRKDILLSLTHNHKQSQAVLAPKIGDKKLTSTTESLLKLFDSVLLEESPIPQPIVPMTPTTSLSSADPLTCDFCGADVFQSFFECLSCIDGPEGSNSPKAEHGDGFVICAGCYVEGRSCKCGDMVPIQCRPFEELLAVRNKVAELLSAYKGHSIPLLDDKVPAFAPGLFRAACKLQELRKDLKREKRICSTKAAGSHVVPCSWALNCKKCHRSRCFTHILRLQKLHAADALLIHTSDSSHEEHHRHHKNSLQEYEDGREDFLQTQRMGLKPDLTQQRVRLAEQYDICKPINSAFMQAGWYDVYVQLAPVNIETKDENNKDESKDGLQNLPTSDLAPHLSPLTETDGAPPLLGIMAPTIRPTVTAMLSSLKRKRTILDFVAVPDRNYKVRISDKPVFSATEPFQSQDIVPDVQLVNSDLSSSGVANNVVCGRDQDVVQTDFFQSPPTNRCNRASHIISSRNSTPFCSQGNENGKRNYKKRQVLSSSPKAPISNRTVSRPTSSALIRSPRAVKRLQSRDMPSTDESENSRLHGRSLTPVIPDQSSGLAEERKQNLKDVRKLPRFKKNSPTVSQTSDEQSSSSSSAYSRSTPSDGSDLTQVLDSGVNESHSALTALDVDPTTEHIPSISNNILEITQPIPTDNNALDKAVKDLADAVRNIAQLQHIPPQSSDSIITTALCKLTTNNSQPMTLPPTLGCFQEKYFPLFQPYPLPSPRKWSTSGYQQSSRQYHDGGLYGTPRFEGGASSRPQANHGHFSHLHYEDGATMRSGSIYRNRRHDSYQEDHMRRLDNQSYPYRHWRGVAQTRERPPRSAVSFDNVHGRQRPYNNWSNVDSYSRTRSGDERGGPTEFAPRAGLAGVKSSTYTLRSQGANNEASIKPHNTGHQSIDGPLTYERSWRFTQALSSSPLELPADCSRERPPSSQVSQETLSPHIMSSPSANSENRKSLERHTSPIDYANWEDYYEQEDPVIDREVPRIELSKPQQNELSSSFPSLYDNPWAN